MKKTFPSGSQPVDNEQASIDRLLTELKALKEAVCSVQTSLQTLTDSAPDHYRRIFRANPHPMWVYDLETLAFLEVNDAAVERYGYSEKEFLGMTIKEIRPAEEIPALMKSVAGTTGGFESAGIWKHRRRDGSLLDVQITSHAITVKGRKARIVTAVDVTEQVNAAEERRRSSALLQAVVQAPTESVFVKDTIGRYVMANRRHAAAIGADLAQLIGKTDADFYPKSVAEEFAAADVRVLRDLKPITREETLLVEGKQRTHLTVKFPWMDDDGRLLGVIGVARDITDRKRMEDALREQEEQYRLLFQRLQHAFAVLDVPANNCHSPSEYLFVAVNPAFEEVMGIAATEVIGKNAETVFTQMTEAWLDILSRAGCNGETVRFSEYSKAVQKHLEGIAYAPRRGQCALLFDDASRRIRMENAIRESQERYRNLVETIDDCIWEIDARGVYTYVSPRISDILGYEPAQMLGRTPYDFMESDEADRVATLFRNTLSEQQPIRSLIQIMVAKDGRHVVLETSGVPFFGPDRSLKGYRGAQRDVTKRQASERELVRLRKAVEASREVIFMTDPNGLMTYVNPQFTMMYGFMPEEVIGKTTPRLLKGGELPPAFYRQFWGSIMAGKPQTAEFRNRRKNGSLVVVEAWVTPILGEGGSVLGFLAIQHDVTERREADERLREQAALLDATADAILVENLDDVIVYWNRGAERIYGWMRDEVTGRSVREVAFQSDTGQLDEIKAELKRTGEWRGELTQTTKDGHRIAVDSRRVLIRDGEGSPKSILVVNTDITERKALERQFFHAQRMESLGTLAGGIAHDLNNVLTPILMGVETLKPKVSDERGQRVLATLEAATVRGSNIVRQVLAFARGVEGERAPIQLRHLLREIEHIIRETFPRNIELSIDLPRELWTVLGDATQLHQVFMNLSVNARDAMLNGGTLKICATSRKLEEIPAVLSFSAVPGSYVEVEVADTGIGIPAENVDKLFDPFFTTKEPGKGTGLGLSTVHAIVKSHKGFVTVQSEIGRGSSFRVFLPAQVTGAEVEVVKAPAVHEGEGETILVVDDELSVLEIVRETLEIANYSVLTARDGTEALTLYVQHRNRIKAVLTDMMMPFMDGEATIKALRRINPRIKIIASSGLMTAQASTELTAEDVQAFLPKPYTAEKILRTVSDVLSGKR